MDLPGRCGPRDKDPSTSRVTSGVTLEVTHQALTEERRARLATGDQGALMDLLFRKLR